MKQHPEVTEKVVTALAEESGMSTEEVVLRMQKPWGLLQLLKGELPKYRLKRIHINIENRLDATLRLINFIEQYGHKKPEAIKELINRLIDDIVNKNDENNDKLMS